jgi:ribosome-binding factor A
MEYRIERIGQLIQEKVGTFIVEGVIKDHRVSPFLSITRVSVSKDLTWADVYVSNCKVTANNPTANIEKGVEGLQSAAGFIQAQLARDMHIRKTPKLRFHADLAMREAFDLIQKIEELNPDGKQEAQRKEENEPESGD